MFWDRYEYLCKKKGKSPNALAKEMGAGTSACTYWKNGTVPKGETLIKIAEIFDCSVDYLLERTNNPQSHKSGNNVSVGNVSGNSGAIGVGNTVTNTAMSLDEQTIEMLNTYQKLSPLNKAKLLVYADELEKTKGEKTFFHVSSHIDIYRNKYLKRETKPFQDMCNLICGFDISIPSKCEALYDFIKILNLKVNTGRENGKWLCEAIFEYIRKTEYPDNPSRVWGVFVVDTPEKAEEFIIKGNRNKESKIFEIVQPVENVFEYDMSFFDFAHRCINDDNLNISDLEKAYEYARRYWRHEKCNEGSFIEYIIDGTNPIHIGGLYKG